MVSSPAPDEGAPASPVSKNVDAGNGRAVASPVSHMHPDVAELLRAADSTARRRRRKKPAADFVHARYDCAFEEEEEEQAPPRLVWAKVFAPADASAPALREKRRRDAILVACFGDGTFVWADADDLLPFRHGFPRLADAGGRSSSRSAFARALDDALDEVSRRVDAGLSCGCGNAGSVMKQQVFVNSGVRRGACGAAVDGAFAKDALRGEALVGYVRALALAPGDGADRLDLAVAAAQLKAFARWRSAANPARDSAVIANGAMVVAARVGRGRAATPRRVRTRRGLLRDDAPAPAPAGDETTLSMCPRAAAAAAADMVFMRHMFLNEAVEEHVSATAVTPPGARAELRGLAVATTAQGKKAFDEWRSPSPPRGIHECTATRGGITGIAAINNGSTGGADAEADAGNCRTVTSCVSEEEISACDDDAAAWETESEDFEATSLEWELGWKEYVMVVQFLAIAMLLCQLIQ
uniref:Uncharacterized protein n=1 Tax=Avena sativa TaxID=4498 RepID=A0ACD5TYL1_AVESA